MKTVIGLILCSSLLTPGFSQGVIQGDVRDSRDNELAFASVLLRNETDSALIKGAISDESGHFVFSDIPKGDYFVEVSQLGFEKSYSPGFHFPGTGKNELPAIMVTEEQQQLDEVTVTATRPLFELEQGKMIVNVATSITAAGLSILEMLDRSPGVSVDRQNNLLSVLGKNGVVILMNGQRFRMPVEAAYQMLAGLNARDVEKIEIITVPPARYDADGDAGFINIVMKTNNGTIGTNGSLTTGQGYGSGYNGSMSFTLNHQGPKFSWFGLLSASHVDQVPFATRYRGNNNGFEDLGIQIDSDNFHRRKTFNYQAGFDYVMGSKTILSGLISGYENRRHNSASTRTASTYSISPDSLAVMSLDEVDNWSHVMGNIHLQHTLSRDQVFGFNLDYLWYTNSFPTRNQIDFYDESSNFIESEEVRIAKDTPIALWVGDATHSIKLGESVALESGIRATFSQLENTVVFDKKVGTEWVFNPTFSSDGVLQEDILAAFSSASIVLDENTTMDAGLRYEHTSSNLTTASGEELVKRDYGNFFPTLFFSRKINSNHRVHASYGRRITRPSFNEMAPFALLLDPYTFLAGNETIKPTYTTTIKADYSFKSLLLSVQHSLDRDVIARFQPTLDAETNILFLKSENVDRAQTVALTLAFPMEFTSWWETRSNLTANYQKINSVLNGEVYEVDQRGIQLVLTNTFTLPNNYTVELLGNYRSPTIQGYLNSLSRGFINLGIQKDFEKAGVLRIACNDLLETNQFRLRSFEDARIDFYGRVRFDNRVFMASYTYKFGNSKIKGTRKRKVGSQEEQKRVTN